MSSRYLFRSRFAKNPECLSTGKLRTPNLNLQWLRAPRVQSATGQIRRGELDSSGVAD
jgi:hypothetical protein